MLIERLERTDPEQMLKPPQHWGGWGWVMYITCLIIGLSWSGLLSQLINAIKQ